MPLMQQAEKQKKIRELTAELETTNQRCNVYRANLLVVLKDMEEQKLKLSVKVQNARLSMKEWLHQLLIGFRLYLSSLIYVWFVLAYYVDNLCAILCIYG